MFIFISFNYPHKIYFNQHHLFSYSTGIMGENLWQDKPWSRTGRNNNPNNLPAYKTLYRLVLSSQEESCEQVATGCMFGTKTREDVKAKRTEAMVNSREGNLSKHSSTFRAHHVCRVNHFHQISFYLCINDCMFIGSRLLICFGFAVYLLRFASCESQLERKNRKENMPLSWQWSWLSVS